MLARIVGALAIGGTLLATGISFTNRSSEWSPTIRPLPTPAAPASAQPQLSSSDRGVLLSWIEREGALATLKFSERTKEGWSKARTVASGTDWFVNWADVPSVVRLADGTLAAHWLQKSAGETYAYDVRLSYSKNDGQTWAASFTPHHDGTKTEHGFASLFQMPGSGLGIAWLDGRQTGAVGAGDHDAHGGDRDAMTVRFATFDQSWKQTADMIVDDRVCDCCPTTVAVTSEGPIAAYRNRTENETRDIHVSRLVDGHWTSSTPVHEDGWRIAACPVNGPMLSARGRQVAAAWFTGKGEEGHAYVAFSDDGGRTFGRPVRLDDTATLGRVDVELLPDGSAVATWIELSNQQAQFRMRRVDVTGARTAPVTIAALKASRAAGYPRLAMHGHELIFAWTDTAGETSRVQVARAAAP